MENTGALCVGLHGLFERVLERGYGVGKFLL